MADEVIPMRANTQGQRRSAVNVARADWRLAYISTDEPEEALCRYLDYVVALGSFWAVGGFTQLMITFWARAETADAVMSPHIDVTDIDDNYEWRDGAYAARRRLVDDDGGWISGSPSPLPLPLSPEGYGFLRRIYK